MNQLCSLYTVPSLESRGCRPEPGLWQHVHVIFPAPPHLAPQGRVLGGLKSRLLQQVNGTEFGPWSSELAPGSSCETSGGTRDAAELTSKLCPKDKVGGSAPAFRGTHRASPRVEGSVPRWVTRQGREGGSSHCWRTWRWGKSYCTLKQRKSRSLTFRTVLSLEVTYPRKGSRSGDRSILCVCAAALWEPEDSGHTLL